MAQEIEEVDSTQTFPQFDVVSDHYDHHYLSSNVKKTNGPDCFTNTSSGVYKKIMKEWRVLEKSLPDTIYVRVYERRVDLLRAAIVGPAGTPYHDGLFFFDIMFPPDYPTRPPMVWYRSFGLRINPNLYANGVVCLSLLNTWYGKKNEKWDPNQSTVLQVLVSIQGLVLNKAPYFNEPGTGIIHPGRFKKSLTYTENAFVLSCKTMVYLLRKPPKNFEEFVRWHFHRNAREILSACIAYNNGTFQVGSYPGSGSGSRSVLVSKSFKFAMKAWYPEMVVAFQKVGVRIDIDLARLGEEKKTVTFKVEKKRGKKMVSFKKVVMKIRKILGIKKVGASDN